MGQGCRLPSKGAIPTKLSWYGYIKRFFAVYSGTEVLLCEMIVHNNSNSHERKNTMDYSNRVYVPQHTPSREVKSEAEHNQIIREATLAERRRLTGLMAQGAPISISVDERDKFKTAAELSISERAGLTKRDNGNEYVGYSLLELARQSLIKAGLPAAEARENSMQMCGRALQTSDFPEILGNVANKALFAGWDGAGETWQEWCGIQAISDFKPTSILAVSEGSSLDEIPEGGEYKYGKRTESKEVVQLATYGKVFAITRQALINDDLSALSDIPTMHGEMANRKIGDTAYSILSNNAPMGDGIDLFHADHSNLVASGSGAAPGVATIAAGILAMGSGYPGYGYTEGLARSPWSQYPPCFLPGSQSS